MAGAPVVEAVARGHARPSQVHLAARADQRRHPVAVQAPLLAEVHNAENNALVRLAGAPGRGGANDESDESQAKRRGEMERWLAPTAVSLSLSLSCWFVRSAGVCFQPSCGTVLRLPSEDRKEEPVPVLRRERVRVERYLVLDAIVEGLDALQVPALVVAEKLRARK